MISYRDHNGTVREWEAVDRVNDHGVVVVIPVTGNKELVLIRQFRPALGGYVVELPAGLIDPGEDVVTAGRRELIEETGYTSKDFTLFTEGVISTGINTEKWRILLARNVVKVAEETLQMHPPDENEDIKVIKVHADNIYEELEKYSNEGDDVDLRIYGLWELAKKKTAFA